MNLPKNFTYADLSYAEVKSEAKSLARAHKKPLSWAYEFMSKTSGYKDWNVFCAYLKSK